MSEHSTHTPHVRRLERSSQSKMFAGVAGGLGRYFDLNPTVFRLGFVVLTLLGGAGVLVYIAAFLVMPAEGEDASFAERVLAARREHPVQLVALAVVGVAIFVLLSRASTWPSAGGAWVLALIVGLFVLWAAKGRRSRWLIAAATLATLVLATVVAAIVTAFVWFDVSLNDGAGNRKYVPASVSEVRHDYELGVGQLKLDLSHVSIAKQLRVKAKVDIGDLRVIVPRNASVVVDSHAKLGDISSLGRQDHGRDAHVHVGRGGRSGELYLDVRVGAGNIDVVRAE
jgi:phage shock protein PspC (stress-responsive transcriptional regulator)/predicted membrane protein